MGARQELFLKAAERAVEQRISTKKERMKSREMISTANTCSICRFLEKQEGGGERERRKMETVIGVFSVSCCEAFFLWIAEILSAEAHLPLSLLLFEVLLSAGGRLAPQVATSRSCKIQCTMTSVTRHTVHVRTSFFSSMCMVLALLVHDVRSTRKTQRKARKIHCRLPFFCLGALTLLSFFLAASLARCYHLC